MDCRASKAKDLGMGCFSVLSAVGNSGLFSQKSRDFGGLRRPYNKPRPWPSVLLCGIGFRVYGYTMVSLCCRASRGNYSEL